MNPLGIMQGRLSPPIAGRIQAFPVASWREEFMAAREAGLACIEWIYGADTEQFNPLGTQTGIDEMLMLSSASGVGIWSVCADYYMTERLVDETGEPNKKAVQHVRWLIGQAVLVGVHHIVIPFVDASSLRSLHDKRGLIAVLREAASFAMQSGIELHLETDLPPSAFVELLEQLNHPGVRVNYDIGNSASLGYQPREELTLLKPWLGSVHVKDRVFRGGTVSLGTGAADFFSCFTMIAEADFKGFFILQAAREKNKSEIELAIHNRQFVEKYFSHADEKNRHGSWITE